MQEYTIETIKSYKNKRASNYIPVRGDEIITKIFECENYSISTKYDGHICFIISEKSNIEIVNYNGEPFERNELIEELSSLIKNSSAIFVGEIFHYKENERTRSFNLVKQVSNKESTIRIKIFDLISFGGKDFNYSDWIEKRKIIEKVFSNGVNVTSVEELNVDSRKDIQNEYFQRVEKNNQEGLIVRGFNGPIFKIKPKISIDCIVLGFVTGYTDDFSLLKELLIGVLLGENEFLIIGKVSNGFSIEQRKNYTKLFSKMSVDSSIIEPSGSKIPFTFVRPEKVIEIESTDIITYNSERIIKKSKISFSENKYQKQGNDPSVSLISPVFIGIREDKKLDVNHCGLNQITRVIELGDDIKSIEEKSKSKLIKKEIYVKEMKSIKMVKKFFLWKTNTKGDSYPSYVFYKIDYSPTRSDKLQRDIKISNNLDQISKIFMKQIESEIKKGWKLF